MRGCRRVSLASVGAPAGLPSGRGCRRFTLWNSALPSRNSALAGPRGHQGPRAGLLRAYESLRCRLDAQQLVPDARARLFTQRAPGPPSTFRPLAASLALVFWAGRTFCGLGCTLSPSAGQRGRPNPVKIEGASPIPLGRCELRRPPRLRPRPLSRPSEALGSGTNRKEKKECASHAR